MGLLETLRERTGLPPEALAQDEERQPEPEPHADAPEGEDDRYAIYAVRGERPGHPHDPQARRRLAETSLQGIGLCLRTLREEGEYAEHDRIGILDRAERTWLVNPWARG